MDMSLSANNNKKFKLTKRGKVTNRLVTRWFELPTNRIVRYINLIRIFEILQISN